MRNLMKAMILGTMIMSLLGCGKEDGGGSSSSSSSTIVGTGTGAVFGSIEEVRSAFENSDLNAGITVGMELFHSGNLYSSNSGSGGFFNISGCFGTTDCLRDKVNSGEIKRITASNSTSISYDIATTAENKQLVFGANGSFDRSDEAYRKMLNLDNKATRQVVVTEASLTLSNVGQVNGNYIEYFFTDGSYEGYLVSSAFPVIANPIAIYSADYTANGFIGNFQNEGILQSINVNGLEEFIVSRQGTVHRIQAPGFGSTAAIQVLTAGQIN